MNEFLAIFLTWQFVILSVSIYAAIHIIRVLVEYFILNNPRFPGSVNSRLWRDLILPLLPIVLGIGFVFIAKSFPYPAILTEMYSRALFSMVAGLLSSTIFRVIKALLNNSGGNSNGPLPYTPPYVQPVPLFPPTNLPQSVTNQPPNTTTTTITTTQNVTDVPAPVVMPKV